jgi:Fic family protein
MKLAATAVRPERHSDEVDGMFVNGLWNLASGGATANECERSLAAEPYRIRRQLAHWVESGALRPIED